jgi:dienelactone hydrolase
MTLRKQELVYESDGKRLVGELVADDTASGPRPGVLVFHEGGGINAHPKERAAQLAELGYVALACDMYGDGEFIADAARRGKVMGALRAEPATLRARAEAGRSALASQPGVDPTRLAAIGFCFGGMVALELARSGSALQGVVSFHGILDTQRPAVAGNMLADILVLHGADDPFVSSESLAKFTAEMKAVAADWQLVVYGNAMHGFTRRDAASLGMPGVAYDAKADARSWIAMKDFLREVFANVA